MIPETTFKVQIEPLIKGGQSLIATVNPIISTLSAGAGTINIVDGYEVVADKIKGQCYPHELEWLIESGQYKIVE